MDSAGRIRWLAQGVVTKQEITDMISLAHSLMTDEANAGSLAEIESRKFGGPLADIEGGPSSGPGAGGAGQKKEKKENKNKKKSSKRELNRRGKPS